MTESTSIQQPTQFKILLIGDSCTDVYQYGTVDRISPEAPVPVFQLSHQESRPGMAGNVRANLLSLGCDVYFVANEDITTKTRLIDSRSKQQIVRIDHDVIAEEPVPFDLIEPELSNVDAVVISDYNKGTVDYTLMEKIIAAVECPVFIDTKKTDLARLQGAWVKINELEYSKITSECTGLIVTRGAKGASVIHHDIECPAPNVEVADVTGAGDTFLAALTYWYLNTTNLLQSIRFAIDASAVTVQHLGVYAPTLKEME